MVPAPSCSSVPAGSVSSRSWTAGIPALVELTPDSSGFTTVTVTPSPGSWRTATRQARVLACPYTTTFCCPEYASSRSARAPRTSRLRASTLVSGTPLTTLAVATEPGRTTAPTRCQGNQPRHPPADRGQARGSDTPHGRTCDVRVVRAGSLSGRSLLTLA